MTKAPHSRPVVPLNRKPEKAVTVLSVSQCCVESEDPHHMDGHPLAHWLQELASDIDDTSIYGSTQAGSCLSLLGQYIVVQ
jgi:hypothetical protein